jgi:glycosyl transferase family 87
MTRRLAQALALAALLVALLAPLALAAADSEDTPPPNGTTELQATRVADLTPAAEKERRENPDLSSSANFQEGHWQVAYFVNDEEVAVVYVDADRPEATEEWTGFQVAWKMARGYSGAFGHSLNSPFVFVPLCLIFLLGLFDWRRWRRLANLDLIFLLGFTVSHFFFNRADIGVSVPLQYPPLIYLLGRALWIGFRGRGEGLRPVWPTAWLVIAALFLIGVRVGLDVADAGVIDVGYAGVVGADKIVHGEPIYGNFPEDIRSGDTYGPVNYLAYVPFERIWPWDGEWDDLPAAHATAIVFDLAALGFLVLLGLRARPGPAGRRLAAILAFGWAAYPYTAYVLESNSNDSLIAALLVATLLVLARPFARGATVSLATFAKFVPAVLGPMLLTYRPPGETRRLSRTALLFAAGFALVGIAAMLWPAIDPGLRTTFDRSLGAQTGRSSPFSVWGQANLEWLHSLLLAAVAILAVALAFVPRRKSLLQVAALSAALVIGVQLTLHHWFYLYIAWFYPLLLVALALLDRDPIHGGEQEGAEALSPTAAEPAPSPARRSPPAPAR